MANPDIPKREGYLKHPEWLNSDIKALGKKGLRTKEKELRTNCRQAIQ